MTPYRVNQVRLAENLTWDDMIENIKNVLSKYSPLSDKWSVGRKSHKSVYNALRRFNEFALVGVQ